VGPTTGRYGGFSILDNPSVASPTAFDPKKAKDLIPIVLIIDDTVLPGSNWTLTRDDWTESPPPDTATAQGPA